jgi:hypothetical protein
MLEKASVYFGGYSAGIAFVVEEAVLISFLDEMHDNFDRVKNVLSIAFLKEVSELNAEAICRRFAERSAAPPILAQAAGPQFPTKD